MTDPRQVIRQNTCDSRLLAGNSVPLDEEIVPREGQLCPLVYHQEVIGELVLGRETVSVGFCWVPPRCLIALFDLNTQDIATARCARQMDATVGLENLVLMPGRYWTV
jgi:hypothetical protein